MSKAIWGQWTMDKFLKSRLFVFLFGWIMNLLIILSITLSLGNGGDAYFA